MTKALITGTTSGIGKEIKHKFENENIEVIECNRDMCDLADVSAIENFIKSIDVSDIDILVNNAGAAFYGLHENLAPGKISIMVDVNLKAPMILCNMLLPTLKKNNGTIINICSITADEINTHGAAYGATKAGLKSFTHSLFAEYRKHGVRCINIQPDMTKTNLYRNANFNVADDQQCYLEAAEVADACVYALKTKGVNDITLRPQKHQIKRIG